MRGLFLESQLFEVTAIDIAIGNLLNIFHLPFLSLCCYHDIFAAITACSDPGMDFNSVRYKKSVAQLYGFAVFKPELDVETDKTHHARFCGLRHYFLLYSKIKNRMLSYAFLIKASNQL